ncbi:sensor histidine kinase [Candidatus Pyrohabitans sp.]
MPWLKSDRRIYSEEGIFGAVLIDSELTIRGTLRDGRALLDSSISEFFYHFALYFGEEEKGMLKDAMALEKEMVLEIMSSPEPINLLIIPIKCHDEKYWLLILKRRDVTLEELEEIKHNILANITHELLTPVTIAKASLEIFGPKVEEDEILSTAMNAIVRLEKLLRDLVRVGPKRVAEVKIETLRIQEVIESALRIMKSDADSSKITIETSIEETLPEVKGDRDALVHLLVVLLTNAIKFSPEGGTVRVYAVWRPPERSLGRGMIEVCVEDAGIGIPPEEQDRVFDLFYQIDRSPSRRYGGMGLGLYLAKNIVLSHNGRIWVESEPGKGARFYFTIPTSTGIVERRL